MRTIEDVESYLIRLGLSYEEVGDGTWVIHDEFEQIENLVVRWTPPLVVFRVKLMDLAAEASPALLRKLLELNATQMVAGAYGIEGTSIVCVDSLQAENLDFNEFQASVDSLTLAITTHYPMLSQLKENKAAA